MSIYFIFLDLSHHYGWADGIGGNVGMQWWDGIAPHMSLGN